MNHEALKMDVEVLERKMNYNTVTNKMLQSIAISLAEIVEMMKKDREKEDEK